MALKREAAEEEAADWEAAEEGADWEAEEEAVGAWGESPSGSIPTTTHRQQLAPIADFRRP